MSDETADYVDYCQTQAGLLAGQIERLEERADRLLTELDEETGDVREALDGDAEDGRPSEAAFSEIEAKQESVIEIQETIERYAGILDGYVELAEGLSEEADPLAAVVRFELDEEAYACFDDRTTVTEQVADIGREE